MEIKIEKGVPIYPIRKKHSKYVSIVEAMEIGDSFFCDKKIVNSVSQTFKRLKYKYATRKENDGFRVWRIG